MRFFLLLSSDLLSQLSHGAEVIDIFLRTLATLNDEVVQQDANRPGPDVLRCQQIVTLLPWARIPTTAHQPTHVS